MMLDLPQEPLQPITRVRAKVLFAKFKQTIQAIPSRQLSDGKDIREPIATPELLAYLRK